MTMTMTAATAAKKYPMCDPRGDLPGWTLGSDVRVRQAFRLFASHSCSADTVTRRADLDGNVPLRPDHCFPARAITKLVTSTTVLRLVADGAIALDDPANVHLRSFRLSDATVTVRELLSHMGGVESLPSTWADTAATVADVLGPVVSCSGTRGQFAYSNGGYAVLGQLIADVTGSEFVQAVTSSHRGGHRRALVGSSTSVACLAVPSRDW